MVTLIAAVAQNGTIGDRNTLLWHITEDMQFFRRTTQGHPVIMGRKTYESLGRPLPKRANVIISRQEIAIEGCTVVHSLEEAIALFPAEEEVFIIGGGQIYAEALPLADRMYLTIVEHDYEGDTKFPAWDRSTWVLRSSERHEHGSEYPHPFRFECYERP
ncbi:MAG: dihydrofolate reductase [Alistipes sp.]|nr:dihydrofolate reductase [Alistipes sp.]